MLRVLPPADRAVYPTHLLTGIIKALQAEGQGAAPALQGCGIEPAALLAHDTRVSAAQTRTLIENALRLSRDPALALRAGRQLHIGSWGMLGYALLSSPSHADVAALAQKYDHVVHPLTTMWFSRDAQVARWRFEPALASDPLAPLYRFSVEMKLSGMLTVMQDLYGADFRLLRVGVAYPAPAHAADYQALLGCPVRFGQDCNELCFDAHRLAEPMQLADPVTHAAIREICEQNLQAFERHSTLSGAIRARLLEQPGQFPEIEAMAQDFGLNARALRRKLSAEGSSYRDILNAVRMELAIAYLRVDGLTNEHIALRLGYSDAANFRQAFARWTGKRPSDYRRA